MSAHIMIQSGISAGTSYWIEKPVLRIGSDPEFDISLMEADLEPHAITLEFRSGKYFAHNRSSRVWQLGAQAIMPGARAYWEPGICLQLGESTRLELTVDGDPTPGSQPSTAHPQPDTSCESAENSALEPGDEKKPSKSLMQMAVTLICLLGAGILLTSSGPVVSQGPSVPAFPDLLDAARTGATTSPALIRRLQYAETMLVRGDHERAKSEFVRLRDDLVKQRPQFRANNRDVELDILAYVNDRVGRFR